MLWSSIYITLNIYLFKQKVERWFPGAAGREHGELWFNGYKVSLLEDKESATDGQ